MSNTMDTPQSEWAQYRKKVMPIICQEGQVLETKRAFVAGMSAGLYLFVESVYSEDDDDKSIKAIELLTKQVLSMGLELGT